MGLNVSIVGATGNVGREFLEILYEREFPLDELFLLASSKSKGKKLKFGEKEKIIDYEKCLYESLIAIKRSGASAIFCYGAIDIAKNLKNE